MTEPIEECRSFNYFSTRYLDRVGGDLTRLALDYPGCGLPPGDDGHDRPAIACACTGECRNRSTLQEAAALIDWIRRYHATEGAS